MKKITVLGSTGSIGRQTLEIIDENPEKWGVFALAAGSSVEILAEQAEKYNPRLVIIGNHDLAKELNKKLNNKNIKILTGQQGLKTAASESEVELVINGIMGAEGLAPSYAALKAGKTLGLANKESMVIGGNILNSLSGEILPIDSEHNAIYQILTGHSQDEIKNIILTASGGPFFELGDEELKEVTVEEALDHPNWNMGPKITIDSATMMNKGLEIIEAHWLFNMPYDKIKVIIHPQSIVHSMVEFIDSSIQAEMGVSDMKLPIQQVMYYPGRIEGTVSPLKLEEVGKLTFLEPDYNKFPALELAYTCGKEGGSMPVVLNAANEIAVDAFLKGKISYLQIIDVVKEILSQHRKQSVSRLEDVYRIDETIRRKTREVIGDVNYDN